MITTNIDSIGGQARQEKTIAAQAGIVFPKNVIRGTKDDQEPGGIRSQMEPASLR